MRATLASVLVLLAAPALAQAPGATGPVSQAPGALEPSSAAPGASAPAQSAPAPTAPPAPAAPTLAPLDLEAIPAPCRTHGKEANAKVLARALSARLSLASCLADAAMAGLSLIDGQESVLLLEEAIAPSRAMLDEVIARADAETQLLAHRAVALLYAGAATRMLQTVPPPVDRSEASIALRDIRLTNVETMIGPWREAEGTAHAAIVKLAEAHPRLAQGGPYVPVIEASRARVGASRP